MCEGWDFCRGFSTKDARHRSLLGIFFFSRDLITKQAYPSTLVQSMTGTYRSSWPVVIRAVRQPRGSIEAQNGGKGTRGNRVSAHSRWRVEVVAGFQRSTKQAVLADSTFTGGRTPQTTGDEKGRRTCS
jgi:hypothetical protein